jgi:hypothetical protein
VQDQLRVLSGAVRRFLDAHIDRTRPDWWDKEVIAGLSYSQQSIARDRGWTSLEDLDLAALLGVLDGRWEFLGRRHGLSQDDRTRLKEARSIRNRWAHDSTAREPDPRQAYRDLDCIALLSAALGAPAEDVRGVEAARDAHLIALLPSGTTTHAASRSQGDLGRFSPGTQVQLVARPEIVGVVVEVVPSMPEYQIKVFHDGSVKTFFSSQLTTVTQASASDTIGANELRAGLTSAQLTHPSSRVLFSLNAARIEFEPYQFRPVLKLIHSDRPRLLIADDVGVGKTIEAGLILKELQARQDISSVLVICPKPLVSEDKWRLELKRFDEDFVHLDGPALRHCLDETQLEGRWPARYRKAILPYSLLDERLLFGSEERGRRRPGLIDLDPPPQFDLVIVDEAHHIRNTETARYRNVRQLIDAAEAVVFLTATPIQTSDEDLFSLLHLLRPDALPTTREFLQMAEPNPHLSAASIAARAGRDGYEDQVLEHLGDALATSWGRGVISLDPRAQKVRELLNDPSSDENRVQVVRALDSLNTFSGFINRTRRRDIGNFTTRKPETVEVEFTDGQRTVYEDLVDLCRRMARQQAPGQPVEFLISTLQRQAASCINGLGPLVEDILQRRLTSEEISEADGDDETEPGTGLLEAFRTEIDAVVAATRALGDDDPKFEALSTIVQQKQTMANNKLLLFSTFRHTLSYLQRRLGTDGLRLGVVHGNVPDAERRELRRRFKLPREDPRALDLLLSSEVGTEGLDYQFCDALVNYDLPWNPMRVEQRIGRIDRRGQRSETVAIINLITPGTVDASIYHRCLYRIGVFQSALGGSEAILGELTREMRSIADNLTLSDSERDDRLRQLADNKLGRLQELQKLEDEQAHLFGLAVKGTDDTAVQDATSPWLTAASIAHLVRGYLDAIDPGRQITLTEDRIAVLRPSPSARDVLLRAAEGLREASLGESRWLRWLKGAEPTRRLVVTAALAEDDPEIEVLGPAHPLVRAAAQAAQLQGVPTASLLARSDALKPGRYPFAIFGWTHLGLRDDFSIRVVSAADGIDDVVDRVLPQVTDFNGAVTMDESDRDTIDRRHYAAWADARAEHVVATQVSLDARLASLRTTHSARTSLITEQLGGASEDRIRRMREGQLRNADIDFQRREAELLKAVSRADLLAEPLCYGVLEVQAP